MDTILLMYFSPKSALTQNYSVERKVRCIVAFKVSRSTTSDTTNTTNAMLDHFGEYRLYWQESHEDTASVRSSTTICV